MSGPEQQKIAAENTDKRPAGRRAETDDTLGDEQAGPDAGEVFADQGGEGNQ